MRRIRRIKPERIIVAKVIPKPTDKELAYFLKGIKVLDTFGCWEYPISLDNHGYGRLSLTVENRGTKQYRSKYKTFKASRISISWLGDNTAPSDALLRHTYDNKLCVNPSHLIVGTHSDNMQDRMDRLTSLVYNPVYESIFYPCMSD